MDEKRYLIIAEMMLAKFPDAQRNKQGSYGKSLRRDLLAEEVGILFVRQRGIWQPAYRRTLPH